MEIVSDSSPLISFSAIGQLTILQKLFPEGITVPGEVWEELMAGEPGKRSLMDAERKGWLKICREELASATGSLRKKGLDEGEAAAIALAREKRACVLLDEHEARQEAKRLNLEITGTVGCLLLAKKAGFILAVKPYLDDMKNTSSFRLSDELYRSVRAAAGE